MKFNAIAPMFRSFPTHATMLRDMLALDKAIEDAKAANTEATPSTSTEAGPTAAEDRR